ncbi:MAG: hypothetical protein RIQ93_2590 [Verrucomicrobiota bacterium]|jgi:hypothetical protein
MQIRRDNEPDRVRRYTTDRQLQRIDDKIVRSVRLYAHQPEEIVQERLEELGREWSIERFLQINVAAVGLTTALLAVTRSQKWGWATCAGLGFFLLHATDGFDPPLPLLRQIGIRTRGEIDREIYALKALRGDFDGVEGGAREIDVPEAESAAQAVGVG